MIIKLRELTSDDHPFGNIQGKEVFASLSAIVDGNPNVKVYWISLEGIVATDASFPRESIISVAQKYVRSKFFVIDGTNVNQDLLDNWQYAANAKEQPILISEGKFIGPKLSQSNQQLVDLVIEKGEVTALEVSKLLEISVPNASTKLKKLSDQGYFLREESSAESGGVEFIYQSALTSR